MTSSSRLAVASAGAVGETRCEFKGRSLALTPELAATVSKLAGSLPPMERERSEPGERSKPWALLTQDNEERLIYLAEQRQQAVCPGLGLPDGHQRNKSTIALVQDLRACVDWTEPFGAKQFKELGIA